MAKVDFGGMVGSNTTKRSGIISGVDTQAMIEEAIEKRKAPIKIEQDTIAFNKEKIAAFSQLTDLFTSFKNSLLSIKGLGFAESGIDAFKAKQVMLNSPSSEDPNKFITITASPKANLGNFTVQVSQIAQNKIIQSVNFATNSTSATNPISDHSNHNLFTPGTFQINGVNITINQGDTLAMIAANINNSTNLSHVAAQVSSPTTGVYNLMLQSTLPGVIGNIIFSDTDNVLNNVLSGSTVLQAEQDAIFLYNGISVQRSTNTIADFIDGVVFKLHTPTQVSVYNANNVTSQPFSMNAAIVRDTSLAATEITKFVDSYNQLIKFTTQQQGRDEYGKYYPTAKIQHDDYIANLVNNIIILTSQIAYPDGLSGGFGITLIKETPANPETGEPPYKNLIALNKTTLMNALNNNFEAVQSQFEFNLTGTTNNLKIYSHGDKINHGSFVFDIDVRRASSDIVRVTHNGNTINMNFTPINPSDLAKGGTLKGLPGSFMDGYEFAYTGAESQIFNINISQGIADRLFNAVSRASKADSLSGNSVFQSTINSLVQQNYDKSRVINEKLNAIESYRETLVKKYSRMEASIVKANMTLTLLEAQLKAMGNS